MVARTLNTRVTNIAGRMLPVHVLVRLAYALGADEVIYLDANTEGNSDNVTGDLVAYTERLVVVGRMEGLSRDPLVGPDTGRMALSVVPRHALLRLDFSHGDRVSSSAAWAPREDPQWPPFGRVSLTYAGLEHAVVLPQGPEPEDFLSFYPSLLDDLAAGGRGGA